MQKSPNTCGRDLSEEIYARAGPAQFEFLGFWLVEKKELNILIKSIAKENSRKRGNYFQRFIKNQSNFE